MCVCVCVSLMRVVLNFIILAPPILKVIFISKIQNLQYMSMHTENSRKIHWSEGAIYKEYGIKGTYWNVRHC